MKSLDAYRNCNRLPLTAIVYLALSGCTFVIPMMSGSGTDKVVGPEYAVRPQSEVQIRLKAGDVLEGRYGRLALVQPADYAARFSRAVQSDPELSSMPSPGDTIRISFEDENRESIEGVFLGVSGREDVRLGIVGYDGMHKFYPPGAISGIERADGARVRISAMRGGAASGVLPNLAHVSMATDRGIVIRSIADIESIVVLKKGPRGGASLVGLAMDALIVVAVATVGSRLQGPLYSSDR